MKTAGLNQWVSRWAGVFAHHFLAFMVTIIGIVDGGIGFMWARKARIYSAILIGYLWNKRL